MKPHLKLYVPLAVALLVAIVLIGNAFFSTRKQPTAQIPDTLTNGTTGTEPAPESAASSRLQESPSVAAKESSSVTSRREANTKRSSSSKARAPEVLEMTLPESGDEDEESEAKSEDKREKRALIPSSVKDQRARAIQGTANQDQAQTVELSELSKVANRKPVELRLQCRRPDGSVVDVGQQGDRVGSGSRPPGGRLRRLHPPHRVK